MYGLGGELLGEYGQCAVGGAWYVPCEKQERVYFVGRLVQVEGAGRAVDRLGTVGQTGTRAYPYGEAQTEFATYRRDGASGLDYAWNRYYSSVWGRFTSADPYVMSGGMGNPQGWNRYAYVAGDPVNNGDPTGLESCSATTPDLCIQVKVSGYNFDPLWAQFLFIFYSGELVIGNGSGWKSREAPSPSKELAGTPGGAGAPPISRIGQALGALNSAISGLDEKCAEVLPASSTLLAHAQDIVFWDARVQGNVLVQNLPGAQANQSNATLASELGSNNAVNLLGPLNINSQYVVVGQQFFSMTLNKQRSTLLHELLHYSLQKHDNEIVRKFQISTTVGDSYSSAFQTWLDNGCKNN